MLEKKGDKIQYEYDFGDSWYHTIKLEKVLDEYDGTLPVCTDGALNSPPEDIGGVPGFEEFKKAIKNPSHPEHDVYMELTGGHYSPEYFDLEEINELLKEDNYGVFEW